MITSEDEELQKNILHGNFNLSNLPPIKPRLIRIFICAPYAGNTNFLGYLYIYICNADDYRCLKKI